jgi:hypothetical protein
VVVVEPGVRCWRANVLAGGEVDERRRRHEHEHGDDGDGLLRQRLLRALHLRQAALRPHPPQGGPIRRRSRGGARRRLPGLQRGARDPRAGAGGGDELPDGQVRRRRLAASRGGGAGGIAVKAPPINPSLFLLGFKLALISRAHATIIRPNLISRRG